MGTVSLAEPRVSVLSYHHVGSPVPGRYAWLTVSPQRFEAHVRWLAAHGYRGIRASDWLAWRTHGTPLPAKPVLVTFDDGYADVGRFALPVLRRYGFSATVFVVTDLLGETNVWMGGPHRLLSRAEIQQWAAESIEFGAHSRSHPDLTALDNTTLLAEVQGSRDALAALLERPVEAFAYPFGRYDARVVEAVRHHFALAFTSDPGRNDRWTDLHRLRRTEVRRADYLFDIACRVRLGQARGKLLRRRLTRGYQRATATLAGLLEKTS
ncbi:MAG: polysaccharide deacetylase family protein [Chloroflexi bacterium]|nr:polysaccharide deacetylase family protein [Chloroflexota bacterium]